MSLPERGFLSDVPSWINEETALEKEKFERLMHQHLTQRSEERHRIILWIVSLFLAVLSIAEMIQMFQRFHRKHSH